MQFLGNNYTGSYHNIIATTATLHSYTINEAFIIHYTHVMTVGCPNSFNACTTWANTLLYW
jgi:hypothetical protein